MGRSTADKSAEETLELIPRSVRDKLDRVAIKLHLKDWQLLSIAERRRLRDLPCETDQDIARYSHEVEQLMLHYTGQAPQRLRENL